MQPIILLVVEALLGKTVIRYCPFIFKLKKTKPYLFLASYPHTSKEGNSDFSNFSQISLKLDDEILEMYEKEPEFGFYIRKK